MLKLSAFQTTVSIIVFYCFVNISSFNFVQCIDNSENIVSVRIKSGLINGKRETSVDGKQLNVFKGIPYAEPPIGDLRFKKPLPVKNWPKSIDAFDLPKYCYQNPRILLHDPSNSLSEDCLYLNIWSPIDNQTTDILKSVMFWIHGGALLIGSASQPHYPGHILSSKGDIVLVSINYR